MFAYGCFPVDFGWDLLPNLTEVVTKLARRPEVGAEYQHEEEFSQAKNASFNSNIEDINEILALFEEAKILAKTVGWDGDFREIPRVIFLPEPDGGTFKYAFIWKHDENGETFVVSEFELPYLDDVRRNLRY